MGWFCLIGVSFPMYSFAVLPVNHWEPLGLADGTQNVYHGFTRDLVHWWTAPLLLFLKKSLTTSSAWCVEEMMMMMRKNR